MADAFIGRTGEFPAARPADPAPTRPTLDIPSPRHGDSTGDVPAGQARSGAGDHPHREPAPFDAFARGNPDRSSRSGGAPWAPVESHQAEPYVPEPSTRPLPPGVGSSAPEPAQPRSAGGRLGRSLRPFGRGKSAEPLTPEPTPISAPLPHPDPVTPPLAVTPAPRADAAPNPVAETPDGKRRAKGGKDEDYVDWVSGLGK